MDAGKISEQGRKNFLESRNFKFRCRHWGSALVINQSGNRRRNETLINHQATWHHWIGNRHEASQSKICIERKTADLPPMAGVHIRKKTFKNKSFALKPRNQYTDPTATITLLLNQLARLCVLLWTSSASARRIVSSGFRLSITRRKCRKFTDFRKKSGKKLLHKRRRIFTEET